MTIVCVLYAHSNSRDNASCKRCEHSIFSRVSTVLQRKSERKWVHLGIANGSKVGHSCHHQNRLSSAHKHFEALNIRVYKPIAANCMTFRMWSTSANTSQDRPRRGVPRQKSSDIVKSLISLHVKSLHRFIKAVGYTSQALHIKSKSVSSP